MKKRKNRRNMIYNPMQLTEEYWLLNLLLLKTEISESLSETINFHMKMRVICNDSNKFQSIHLRTKGRKVRREQEKETEG